jgi:hypothetical protein
MLVTALALLAQSSPAQNDQAQNRSSASNVIAALEKSGLRYTKVSDGVWEIPATSKNVKDFAIRVAAMDDTLIVLVKLVDRKYLMLKEALLVKMLELNDYFDTAKLALDENMLYARMDLHSRLVDEQELKYLVEQMANVVNETYPHIKPFITDAK